MLIISKSLKQVTEMMTLTQGRVKAGWLWWLKKKKKKEIEPRMKSAPASTDLLAAVSVQSLLPNSTVSSHHWEQQKSDKRRQILIMISDHICSKAFNETLDSYESIWRCAVVPVLGFSFFSCIIENVYLNILIVTVFFNSKNTNLQCLIFLNEAQYCHHVD